MEKSQPQNKNPAYSAALLWSVIKLDENAIKHLSQNKDAVRYGVLFLFLYGAASYMGFQALFSEEVLKQLPEEVLNQLPGFFDKANIPMLVSARMLFGFVMMIIIHYSASKYAPGRSFWRFFAVSSQGYVLGLLSAIPGLDILVLWSYAIMYKVLKVLYGLKRGLILWVFVWSFALFFMINSLLKLLIGGGSL